MGDVGHGGETKHTLTELKQIMLWHIQLFLISLHLTASVPSKYTDSSR